MSEPITDKRLAALSILRERLENGEYQYPKENYAVFYTTFPAMKAALAAAEQRNAELEEVLGELEHKASLYLRDNPSSDPNGYIGITVALEDARAALTGKDE